VADTGLNVGSPAEVVEQVLAQREFFGAVQRQLFAVDMAGIPERVVHEQLDLIGSEVLPVLRQELDADDAGGVPGRRRPGGARVGLFRLGTGRGTDD
jgi:hypothetical protein